MMNDKDKRKLADDELEQVSGGVGGTSMKCRLRMNADFYEMPII